MPEVIHPLGISPDRQKYLCEEIRKFCEPEFADVTCPRPDSPLGDAGHSSNEPVQQPAKRARLRSHCRGSGHTKTVKGRVTCPQLK